MHTFSSANTNMQFHCALSKNFGGKLVSETVLCGLGKKKWGGCFDKGCSHFVAQAEKKLHMDKYIYIQRQKQRFNGQAGGHLSKMWLTKSSAFSFGLEAHEGFSFPCIFLRLAGRITRQQREQRPSWWLDAACHLCPSSPKTGYMEWKMNWALKGKRQWDGGSSFLPLGENWCVV